MCRPVGTTRAKKPIQKAEYKKLMYATKKSLTINHSTRIKLQRAFTLLYLTGCRISEIVNISRVEVEEMIEHNEFSLRNNTKTKKPRLISFDDERKQVKLLKEIVPYEDEYLFRRNGSSKPMGVESLKLMMNNFIHAVLGELYSTHSFRSGYITTQHSLGFSLEHIREDIGHSSIATTARYATVTRKDISLGKNKIDW